MGNNITRVFQEKKLGGVIGKEIWTTRGKKKKKGWVEK